MNKRSNDLLKKLNKKNNTRESAVERFKVRKRKEITILILLITIFISAIWFLNSNYVKLKNINVNGLNQISKDELLEKIAINNDVKIWAVRSDEIKNIIKDNYNIVKDVNVNITLLQTITIDIEEYDILAQEKNENGIYQYVMANGEVFQGKINKDFNIPILEKFIEIPAKKKEVIRNLSELRKDVLSQISEIVSDDINADNAIIYMRDGLRVKVISSNFSSKLNYYFEMDKHIEDKQNSILNLINGSYVETAKTIQQKESKIKDILNKSNNPSTIKKENSDNSQEKKNSTNNQQNNNQSSTKDSQSNNKATEENKQLVKENTDSSTSKKDNNSSQNTRTNG